MPGSEPGPWDYTDAACDVLGGEGSDFMVTAEMRGLLDADDLGRPRPTLRLYCRVDGCRWGYTIGEMELWELVTDARDHFEKQHRPA